MNQTLIALVAMFIATIGHTPRSALKATSISPAVRFSTRKRSTRACSRETISSAEPAHPSRSSQWSASQVTVAQATGEDIRFRHQLSLGYDRDRDDRLRETVARLIADAARQLHQVNAADAQMQLALVDDLELLALLQSHLGFDGGLLAVLVELDGLGAHALDLLAELSDQADLAPVVEGLRLGYAEDGNGLVDLEGLPGALPEAPAVRVTGRHPPLDSCRLAIPSVMANAVAAVCTSTAVLPPLVRISRR